MEANEQGQILLWHTYIHTHKHTQKGAKEKKKTGRITCQWLGEALIDGNAPRSVSIWTWLTWSYARHSSLAGVRLLHSKAAFYLERHLGTVLGSCSFCFASILKAHIDKISRSSSNASSNFKLFIKPGDAETKEAACAANHLKEETSYFIYKIWLNLYQMGSHMNNLKKGAVLESLQLLFVWDLKNKKMKQHF